MHSILKILIVLLMIITFKVAVSNFEKNTVINRYSEGAVFTFIYQ